MPKPIEQHYRFAIWRKASGLTLQEVADSVGCSKQVISYYELGDRDIGVTKLEAICSKAFRVDLVTYFGQLPKIPEAA